MEVKFLAKLTRHVRTIELEDGPNPLKEKERWYLVTMPEVQAKVKASRPSLARWWFAITMFGGPGARSRRYLKIKETGPPSD